MSRNESVDVIVVRITIAARPETIFSFLSDPEAFQSWMGAGSSLAPGNGGAYKVAYPNGDVAAGVVEEIVPNERVVMSWGYEGGANELPLGSTRVEISLAPVEGGTRVTLRHSGLRDPMQRKNHRAGWRHYLATMSQLASAGLDAVIEERINAYTAAWSAHDSVERVHLLQSCWGENAVFRDSMGYAEGIDDLSDSIGMAQRFAPGIVLERTGPASRSHSFASYRWRMTTPDGTEVMRGSNTAEFDADGMLLSMTGFWYKPSSAA